MNAHRRFVVGTCLSAVIAALGCASASDQVAVASDGEDALSAKTASYVSVRRDVRLCPAPLCGGYFIHELNRETADRYVSSLDVSALGWTDDDRQRLIGDFEDNALVVRGTLGPANPHGTRALLVTEAYRGMPGVRAAETHDFYTMSWEDDESYYDADKINTSWSGPCDAVGIDSINVPLLDRTWLGDRALHGAIVAGHMDVRTMGASQVFVRLPDRAGPCPYLYVPKCDEGQVLAYTRTAQRCLVPAKCVTPAICPLYVPNCESGYRRASWMSPTTACMTHACDPSFVDP
jgi:hypothetical protein